MARGEWLGWGGYPYPTLFPPFRFLFSPSFNKEPVHRLASEMPSDAVRCLSFPLIFLLFNYPCSIWLATHFTNRSNNTAPTMVNLQTASSTVTENNAFVCYFQVRKRTLQLTIELDCSRNIPKPLHLFFCLRSLLSNYKGLHLQSPLKKNPSFAFCKLIFL